MRRMSRGRSSTSVEEPSPLVFPRRHRKMGSSNHNIAMNGSPNRARLIQDFPGLGSHSSGWGFFTSRPLAPGSSRVEISVASNLSNSTLYNSPFTRSTRRT
jgi:hypothetical protein